MFGQLLPNKNKKKNSDSAQCFVHRIGELDKANISFSPRPRLDAEKISNR
jgi:hypothetical protein